MKPVRLIGLLVANDIRLHPARNATRVFQEQLGYQCEWYPPHLFRVSVRTYIDRPEGPDNPTHERWFAATNCESWEVAPGETVELDDSVAKMQLTGIVEISKQIAGLRELMTARRQAEDKPVTLQSKAK